MKIKYVIVCLSVIMITISAIGVYNLGPRKLVLAFMGVRFTRVAFNDTDNKYIFSTCIVRDSNNIAISSAKDSNFISIESNHIDLYIEVNEINGEDSRYKIDSRELKWFVINNIEL